MSEVKAPFRKWVYPVAILGFILFLLYLLSYGDLEGVASALGTANLGFYALAFGCVLGSILFHTLAWRSMLRSLSVETKFQKVFSLSLVGNFVDALVPGAWAGDIFKAYLLSKDQDVNGTKVAASIVLKNVTELLITVTALVTGIILLALNYTLDGGIMLTLGTVMFLMALPLLIVIYLSVNLKATVRLVEWCKRVSARIRVKPAEHAAIGAKLRNQLQEFHDGILLMKTCPRKLARPMIFQVCSWLCDTMALFAIFASLGYIVGPDKVVITNTLVVGIQTQGVALAGFAQMVSSTVYTVLGISPILAITSSLLAGISSFWFKMAVSYFAFHRTVFARRIPSLAPTGNGFVAENCVNE